MMLRRCLAAGDDPYYRIDRARNAQLRGRSNALPRVPVFGAPAGCPAHVAKHCKNSQSTIGDKMIIPQRAGHKGSLRWIQELVNQRTSVFNREIAGSLRLKCEDIQWLSPLAQDDYSEYRDGDFLDVFGLDRFSKNLKGFWPKSGPQWDALGRTEEGGPFFLVEAKANIPEITSSMKASSGASIALIRKSLGETAGYLECRYSDLWENGFYQYVNRMAHLYFLRQVCRVEAYLVFLYFVGDASHMPTSLEQWQGALRLQKTLLGLKRHRLGNFVAEVFIDTDDFQNG